LQDVENFPEIFGGFIEKKFVFSLEAEGFTVEFVLAELSFDHVKTWIFGPALTSVACGTCRVVFCVFSLRWLAWGRDF
jgi:hypothetical protein